MRSQCYRDRDIYTGVHFVHPLVLGWGHAGSEKVRNLEPSKRAWAERVMNQDTEDDDHAA